MENKEVPLLNEESVPGNCWVDFEAFDEDINNTGKQVRKSIGLPELSEPQVVRHFTNLSKQNYSIDAGFYPLGSCTMKYNPRLNEKVARLPGFASIHPLQPESTVQWALELMYVLQDTLAKITGLTATSLVPSAGAHGEYAGISVIKKAHLDKEGTPRKIILTPDSAHGTNPATAAGSGYDIKVIKSNHEGIIDSSAVKELVDLYKQDIAAVMITNPNTCGKFEKNILEISKMVHDIGAYFYCDGANLNAIVGKIKPADFGVDVMHSNLHKTFSTPHGWGGPGCGAIMVNEKLAPYLPNPYVTKEGEKYLLANNKKWIGKINDFHGQFWMFVRALAYIMANGKDGLRQVAEDSVLSANYILHHLKNDFHVPYPGACMHECLLTDKIQKDGSGITTLDIAKALIEYWYHPMTMYFPLTVTAAMLIEPTETESKTTLDQFIKTMLNISTDIKNGDGEKFKTYPLTTPRRRVDEVKAARTPILTWNETQEEK